MIARVRLGAQGHPHGRLEVPTLGREETKTHQHLAHRRVGGVQILLLELQRPLVQARRFLELSVVVPHRGQAHQRGRQVLPPCAAGLVQAGHGALIGDPGTVEIARLAEDLAEGREAQPDLGGVGPEGSLADRHGSLGARSGLGVLPGYHLDVGEVDEGLGHLRVVGSPHPLADREAPLQQRLRGRVVPHELAQGGQVVEHPGDGRMLLPEHPLADLQRPFPETSRFHVVARVSERSEPDC